MSEETPIFKKRKIVGGSRKQVTAEDIDDDTTLKAITTKVPSKVEKVTTKTSGNETKKAVEFLLEKHSFGSSSSAMPSGPTDQRATVDTSDDKAVRISGAKAGPVKSSSNLRISCRFDYQPDVCKDYKETGYCGYGDSCKFLHDRGDYKTGWQLEREYDAEQKAKQNQKLKSRDRKGEDGANNNDDDDKGEYFLGSDSEDDGLPFACLKCKNPFVDPVVTKCKHYFCEKCATEHFKKNQRCYVCKEQTEGVFKVATDIIKKMNKKKGSD
jgi:RING finger protein 113A